MLFRQPYKTVKLSVLVPAIVFVVASCLPGAQTKKKLTPLTPPKKETPFIKLYPSIIIQDFILFYNGIEDVKKEHAGYAKSNNGAGITTYDILEKTYTRLKEKNFITAKQGIKTAISGRFDLPSLYNIEGIINCTLGNYKNAIINFEKAIVTWNKNENHISAKIAIINKGVAFALDNKKDKAISLFLNGIENTDSFNKIQIKSTGLSNLAPLYLYKQDIDSALEVSLKALELSKQIKDKKIELLTSLITGKIYFIKEEYVDVFNRDPFEDSIRHTTDALYLSRELKELRQEIDVINLFGYISLEGGVIEDGSALFEKSFEMSSEINYSIGIIDSLRGLANIAMFEENFEESTELFSEAITMSRKINYIIGEINCLTGIGDVYSNNEEYEKALTYFNDALTLSKKINYVRFNGNIITKIADSYFKSGDYTNAILYHQNALTINSGTNYSKGKVTNLTYLAISYRKTGDNILARKFSQKAIDLTKVALKFRKERGININNLANIYIAEGNWREGKRFFSRSLELSKVMGDNKLSVDNLTNLGIIYQKEDELEKAYKYFFDALQLSKKEGLYKYKVNNLINLGNYFRLNTKHDMAADYYKEALRVSKDTVYPLGLANSLALIGFTDYLKKRFDSAQKNLKEALALYKKLDMPRDEKFVLDILDNIN